MVNDQAQLGTRCAFFFASAAAALLLRRLATARPLPRYAWVPPSSAEVGIGSGEDCRLPLFPVFYNQVALFVR